MDAMNNEMIEFLIFQNPNLLQPIICFATSKRAQASYQTEYFLYDIEKKTKEGLRYVIAIGLKKIEVESVANYLEDVIQQGEYAARRTLSELKQNIFHKWDFEKMKLHTFFLSRLKNDHEFMSYLDYILKNTVNDKMKIAIKELKEIINGITENEIPAA